MTLCDTTATSTKSWLVAAAVSGFISSALRLPAVVVANDAADLGDGYVNPCRERGVADRLNALYNDPVGPDESCSDDGSSYKCSGVFSRAGLGRVRTYEGMGGIATPVFPYGIEDPKYTIGVGNLTSAVCPADIVDGEEYPGFCADPTHIYVGSMSFSYLRKDIAPPISYVQHWEETGIDAITGLPHGPPTVGWPGGGFILMQEDSGYLNPDVVLPTNQESGEPSSSFWEFDRMGSFFPMDGASFGRMLCGDGPSILDLWLGISGPVVDSDKIAFMASNSCPPDAAGWENLALTEGYEKSCPVSALESVDAFYDHWFANVNKTFNDIDCSSEEYLALTEEGCKGLLSALQFSIQAASCGIPPESFDRSMIPVSKTLPIKVLYENLVNYGIPQDTAFNFGYWNEATIKAWNGIGLPDLASALIFWYDEVEGSEELANQRAREFYYASGINGGANIRIPVVYRDNRKTFHDPSDGDYTELFSCPPEEEGGGGGGGVVVVDVAVDDVVSAGHRSPLFPSIVSAVCAIALLSAAM